MTASNSSAGRTQGGARGAMLRDNRREARRRDAEAHTREMAERLGGEVERSVRGTTFFDKPPVARRPVEGVVPVVRVVDKDGVAAVLELGRGRADLCDLAILDFASFTYPGGGYDRGTMGQEQALCSESFLYNVLKGFGGWYAENRRRNINCELYRDRALVVPKVRFEREKYHSYADVIVAAAPNARRAAENYHLDETTMARAMRSRIRFVLDVCDYLGITKVVLGAFGCGVFGWDAGVVAELFREELSGGAHGVAEVTFAVPRGRRDRNLEHFQHAFAKFPERNDEPFEVPVSKPAKEAPKPEEDEGEEDWRKYL